MIWKTLPENFVQLEPYELANYFEGLSLVKVEGESSDFIFLSLMLHGNEPCGLRVAQKLIEKYKGRPPRGLVLLIGNVEAAKSSVRRSDKQADYKSNAFG